MWCPERTHGSQGPGRCWEICPLPSLCDAYGRESCSWKRSVPQDHHLQMGDHFIESLWLSASLSTRCFLAKCRRRPTVSDTLPFLTSFYHPFLPQSPSMPKGSSGCPPWLILPLEGGEQLGSRLWPRALAPAAHCTLPTTFYFVIGFILSFLSLVLAAFSQVFPATARYRAKKVAF